MYMYNPCVEMDNILGMEVGNSYNGLYIHHFNLQEKCLVLVVLDLNVYCWLTEAVSAHFIYMDVPFCKGVQLWNRYILTPTDSEQVDPSVMVETFFFFLDIY